MKTFKEYLTEYGGASSDIRNMTGASSSNGERYNGEYVIFNKTYIRWDHYDLTFMDRLPDFKVELDDQVFEIKLTGKKSEIKKYLKSIGIKPSVYKDML